MSTLCAARLWTCSVLLLTALPTSAAEFIPLRWQKLTHAKDLGVFKNPQSSVNEMIVVQAIHERAYDGKRKLQGSLEDFKSMREKALNVFGLAHFQIHAVGQKRTGKSRDKKVTVMQSSFWDRKHQPVQVVERFYGEQLSLTYVVDGPSVDRQHSDQVLNAFEALLPLELAQQESYDHILDAFWARIVPQAEAVEGDSIATGVGAPAAGVFAPPLPEPKIDETPMKSADIENKCSSISNRDDVRKPGDPSFWAAMTGNPKKLLSDARCFYHFGEGDYDALMFPLRATMSYLRMEGAYFRCAFDSDCRHKVDATSGIIMTQFAKDPATMTEWIVASVSNALAKECGDLYNCLTPAAKLARVCNFIGNATVGWLTGKLMLGIQLNPTEEQQLRLFAADLMRDLDHPHVVDVKPAIVAAASVATAPAPRSEGAIREAYAAVLKPFGYDKKTIALIAQKEKAGVPKKTIFDTLKKAQTECPLP